MDDDNAGISTHQIILIEQHGDRRINTKFRKRIGQQERQHKQLAAAVFESRDRISRRNAENHGNHGCDNRYDKRLHNRRNQTILTEYIFPPLEPPFLWENIRRRIFVGKGQHQHVENRPVKKQNKYGKQNKFQKLSLSYRMIESLWIEHFEHEVFHPFLLAARV